MCLISVISFGQGLMLTAIKSCTPGLTLYCVSVLQKVAKLSVLF